MFVKLFCKIVYVVAFAGASSFLFEFCCVVLLWLFEGAEGCCLKDILRYFK
jgi:hypothetical protein